MRAGDDLSRGFRLGGGLFSCNEFAMLPKVGKSADCLMCAPCTVEGNVYNSGKAFLLLSQADVGIRCGICNRFCCIKCLKKVVSVFPNDKHAKRHHWYMYVTAFLSEIRKDVTVPKCYPSGPFVGNCCELRFLKRQAGVMSPVETSRLDGCLFLPEYKLIISPGFSNDGVVDIHGFGGFLPHFNGVVHCVPSHSSCLKYEREGVTPSGVESRFQVWPISPATQYIQLPYETGKEMVCFGLICGYL
jgi:hypothetical protein